VSQNAALSKPQPGPPGGGPVSSLEESSPTEVASLLCVVVLDDVLVLDEDVLETLPELSLASPLPPSSWAHAKTSPRANPLHRMFVPQPGHTARMRAAR
jgi:hypothetical protein